MGKPLEFYYEYIHSNQGSHLRFLHGEGFNCWNVINPEPKNKGPSWKGREGYTESDHQIGRVREILSTYSFLFSKDP